MNTAPTRLSSGCTSRNTAFQPGRNATVCTTFGPVDTNGTGAGKTSSRNRFVVAPNGLETSTTTGVPVCRANPGNDSVG